MECVEEGLSEAQKNEKKIKMNAFKEMMKTLEDMAKKGAQVNNKWYLFASSIYYR